MLAEDDGVRRVEVVVHGVVQGVGFRWAAREAAARFGVSGTARNRSDGTVEVQVEGQRQQVDAMLQWLAHGPSTSMVERVDTRDVPPRGESGFHITS
ncbi:acylphosphatase [Pseudoclavibacter endophyticus]|uniref:acylphosphatase n=1 Tax=Pseudoclavibacter endophyticus TaxID=1778590 RepID=A0A6H9WSW9_9MICO|nr:acylphosphatase [Pseudoclavibacter endophyticus]KAB1649464.1 acylphosphatase [Pseudoclavibacter endophyticus]